ncbi:FG-GAP repeat protein, partial [Pedobacter sp.]
MKKFLLTILCLGNIAVYAQQYYQTAKIVDMPENQRRSMRNVGYGVGLSSTHVLAGSHGAPLQQLVFGDARVSPAYFATLGINGNIGNIAKFDWNRPNYAYGTGFGQSVALSDDYAVVGEPFDFNEATQQPGDSYGAISVYEKSSGWVLKQKLIASSQVKYDNFGYEVKLAGNQILVGLNPSRSSSGDGKVYVFERNGAGTWEQVQLLTPTAAQQPFGRKNFGARISVSGDFMVVHSQPRIFVYQRVAGVWSVYQVFEPNHGNDGVYSSYGGVAISGDYIAISETEAMRDKNGQNIVSGAGAVFIYEKNNATQQWVFTQKIVSPERLAHAYQFFGSAVAMEGSKLVIGARGVKTDAANENYHDKLDGAVYVFERNGDGNWVQLQKIVSNDRGIGSVGAEFGSAVAIKDNKIAVGAYNNCTDLQGIEAMNSYMMGATYVFTSFQQGALPSSTASSSGVMGKVNNLLLMSENKEPIVTLGISGAQNLFKNYTTAKVWKQATEQTSEGKLYLSRNYQITPTTNAATSTGTVTLYFNQQEFLDFNANPAKTADFPTNPTDLQGIANLRILKISGSSSDNSGLVNTYSGTQLVINPDYDKIVWNA